ncbi:MAG: M23 family metallopeptidase [Oscillospiraceae bacterium]|jgi:murein DD-endopeptidase MepM/ murein hydrolase activator NlpD|nr:M23 family metallopeptidase [Oscillospiraceae bacterium]
MDTVRKAWQAARKACKSGLRKCAAFVERQSFYVVLGVCVAVIVGAAAWTAIRDRPPAQPPQQQAQAEEEPGAAVGGEADFVQSLQDVTWVTAPPAATPIPVTARQNLGDNPGLTVPLAGETLRPHNAAAPVYQRTLGAWAVHLGVDIAGQPGDAVTSAGSGTVSAAYADALLGNVLEVSHPGGWLARYAGLATLDLLRVGDPVQAGQLLSHLGENPPQEGEDAPHLHFELLRDGQWVNPQDYIRQTK